MDCLTYFYVFSQPSRSKCHQNLLKSFIFWERTNENLLTHQPILQLAVQSFHGCGLMSNGLLLRKAGFLTHGSRVHVWTKQLFGTGFDGSHWWYGWYLSIHLGDFWSHGWYQWYPHLKSWIYSSWLGKGPLTASPAIQTLVSLAPSWDRSALGPIFGSTWRPPTGPPPRGVNWLNIEVILRGYSLIYGRYLQFRILKWPLSNDEMTNLPPCYHL